MSFERFFNAISYAAVFCGFLCLWVTRTFGLVESVVFLAVFAAAWFLEGSRWVISEKIGTALIVLALPGSYLAYRSGLFTFYGSETVIAGILARMILVLSAIKLLQRKSDRDWIFLYLMSFFEVLLAAGLSISLLYVGSLFAYLLVMVCSVIAFEMRKTSREVDAKVNSGNVAKVSDTSLHRLLRIRKLTVTAVALIAFIALVALPLFFMLPRVGGAGLGSYQNNLSTSTGFSDTVRLGGIGQLQQNDAVVMRVKLDSPPPARGLYFRGVALDTFDNRSWSRSKPKTKQELVPGDKGLIQLDFASGKQNLLVQTIYLEPLDTPVLFAVPRTVAIQGNFTVLSKDPYGDISFLPNNDRVSYKALSDTTLPPVETLRSDNQAYSIESANYLQLPERYDDRISKLAATVVGPDLNRYDKAVAIESYLRNNYGYTLQMRAAGPEPVADFLFNIKQGHCEYFASAMAVMLRTQGVATRIVNGFHNGEYNDTAGMFVVRQRHAHAWVEVYFPKTNVWVPFDPTPASDEAGVASGILGKAGKYLEALDAIWIQYFVAFDNQEQHSLARSLRTGFVDYQAKTGAYLNGLQAASSEWWAEVRGDNGLRASIVAMLYGLALVTGVAVIALLFVWLYRRVLRLGLWKHINAVFRRPETGSIVQYYDRLLRILAAKGYVRAPHLTPLEFASSVGDPLAIFVTQKYNAARFGDKKLAPDEVENIEMSLSKIEKSLESVREK